MARANNPDSFFAYAMIDQPMPLLYGFPIRLVVPGWYATYWVKALNDINVLAEPFKGYWMDKAYRVSKDPHARETPDKLATDTVPISAMTTRSLIIKPQDGQQLASGTAVEVQGVAINDGSGIDKVEVSHRRRQNLDAGQARCRSRQIFLAPLALRMDAQRRRQVAHHGPRHERQWADAGNRAVESQWLRPRCHRTHRRHRRVKGIAMKKLKSRFVVIGSSLLGGVLVISASMLSAQATQSASSVHSIPYPQIAPPNLPEAPGKEAFSANCVICHTYRYVTTQPKFSKKVWTAEVDKMRKTYGATIVDDQVPAIIDYLVAIRGS